MLSSVAWFVMVVAARIEYILSRIAGGDHATISCLPNVATGKMKFKILIRCSDASPSPLIAESSYNMLHYIRQLAIQFSAVDRGHRHSDGTMEICIWLTPWQSANSNRTTTKPVPTPVCSEDSRALTPVPVSDVVAQEFVHTGELAAIVEDHLVGDVAPLDSCVKDDSADDAQEELCNFIVAGLEKSISAIQQRREQIESVHVQWRSVPMAARALDPVVALRTKMQDMMEEQNTLEEKFADDIKDMVKHHNGGAAVLAAVRLRCSVPSSSSSNVKDLHE